MRTASALPASPRPRPGRPARPPLRLVEPRPRPARRTPAQRRRAVVGAGVAVAVMGLFALAAFQALLVQGQAHVDRLHRQLAAEQQRFDRLRAEVAQLEAPGNVVDAAQRRLGMVPPERVTYVTAAEPSDDGPAATAPGRWTGPAAAWARVKPHASGMP